MDFPTALKYAGHIVAWLHPFCVRIEVAGSVRRRRPWCNDIDLVVIPKFGPAPTDMFGNLDGLPPNLLHNALVNYVRDANAGAKVMSPRPHASPIRGTSETPSPRWQTGENNPDGTNFIIQLPKCQLDIYIATDENWGSKLVQRTGSKEHNIWLAARAKTLGHYWELDKGIVFHGRQVVGDTEDHIYSCLGLDFIPPEHREGGCLNRFIRHTPTLNPEL